VPSFLSPQGWGSARVTEPPTPEEAAEARRIPPWVLNRRYEPPPYTVWDSTLELVGWAALGLARAASALKKLADEINTPGTGLFFVANDPALGPIALAVGAVGFIGRASLKVSKLYKGLWLGTDLWRATETLEDFRFVKGPVFFDVVVHGVVDQVTFGYKLGDDIRIITAAELADLIRKAGWSGQPIRLIACESGLCRGGEIAAQKVANLLGTPVLAPKGRPEVLVGTPGQEFAVLFLDSGAPYRLFVPRR